MENNPFIIKERFKLHSTFEKSSSIALQARGEIEQLAATRLKL